MPVDRRVIQQLSKKKSSKGSGILTLLRSLHQVPELKNWITLETIAIPPIPVKREEEWKLISLLTVPTRLEDGSNGWISPWGMVEWSWKDKRVVQKIDLRKHPAFSELRTIGNISQQPTDKKVKLTPRLQKLRQQELFDYLETVLQETNLYEQATSKLSKYYAGLLPKEIYPFYHAIIPESKDWLVSDVEANQISEKDSSLAYDGNEFESSEAQKLHINSNKATEMMFAQGESEAPDENLVDSYQDLTESLLPWLHQAQQLAEYFSLKESIVELRDLHKRLQLPGFRLAVVGEFSRGKSRLINRLLNREILPMGASPTTATLISITAGDEDQMSVTWGKGKQEVRALNADAWEDLLATSRQGHDQTVMAGVRIVLNHEWLESLDIELLDTPGAGDLNEQRANLVFQLLSHCDAAILVVSATLPVSLTERCFLEEEVIGRHIPKILVAVSKLDTISVDERADALLTVKQRIAAVSSAIAVLPTYPIAEDESDDEVLSAIRTQVESMAAQDGRRTWRSHQLSGQLKDCLGRMAELGKQSLAAHEMTTTEREKALSHAQGTLQDSELQWEQLQLELEQRRLQRGHDLREKLAKENQELEDMLLYELSRAPEPKAWWERDLPYRLRHELISISRKSEGYLLKAIAQDFEWLQQQAAKAFKTELQQSETPNQSKPVLDFDWSSTKVVDTRQYRLLTRIGSSAAMVGSYLLSPVTGGISVPVGMVASTGIWVISELQLNKTVKAQRQRLSKELKQRLTKEIDQYSQTVGERLRQLYSQLLEDTKKQQRQWITTKTQALQMAHQQIDDAPDWQALVEQADAIQIEIQKALATASS